MNAVAQLGMLTYPEHPLTQQLLALTTEPSWNVYRHYKITAQQFSQFASIKPVVLALRFGNQVCLIGIGQHHPFNFRYLFQQIIQLPQIPAPLPRGCPVSRSSVQANRGVADVLCLFQLLSLSAYCTCRSNNVYGNLCLRIYFIFHL